MEWIEKCIVFRNSYYNRSYNSHYQFPVIIKILLDSQMYVVTGVEFIFSISIVSFNFVFETEKSSSPGLPPLHQSEKLNFIII